MIKLQLFKHFIARLFLPFPMRVARFEKVTYEQFRKDITDLYGDKYKAVEIQDMWDNIKLPKRATKGSAGYDFFAPFPFTPSVEDGIVIPTGIRCKIDLGWVLKIYPRSGQGFRYGMHEYNTVGIIDNDYYYANNEGHIMVKLSCRKLCPIIDQGVGFCQGIFEIHGITEDDNVTEIRTGGLGSTTEVKK